MMGYDTLFAQDASPEAGTRHQSLTVAAPLLVRPITMSTFLQLLGVLGFNALYQKAAAQRR